MIAGRMHSVLQHKIKEIEAWWNVDDGIEISEFEYRAAKWTKSRRVVVVRQNIRKRPKASGKKLALFDTDLYYKNFRYHCFITNQTLPTLQIWNQYKQRADAENRIKELKEDFGAEGFTMDDFYATEAAMRMVMVAYNLMSLYRQVTRQTRPQPTLATLRFNCFAVGSWIVRSGNRHILKMSVPLKRRQWFDGLFSAIMQNQFPLSLQI